MVARLLSRGWRPTVAALACGAAAAVAGARAPRQPTAAAYTVIIEGMHFSPAALQVRRGERIVWVNKDLVPHTVTARDGRFDSKTIAAGASWAWMATTPGTVAYVCVYHPQMTATVTIR